MKYKELVNEFLKIYGESSERIRIFEAPGRVNLIGEHIDYNGGHVFPVALELKNIVVARTNGTNKINMRVTSLPDRVSASINSLEDYKCLKWGNYQIGVAYILQKAGYEIIGCDILYHGTVPYGAGLSSSASIEVATAIALAKMGGKEKLNMVEIALLCQKAENKYVGMNCGIMDQFVSALARKGHAMFLDCNTLEYEHVPFDLGDYTLAITNTNTSHKLTDSQYNERRSECERALEIINKNGGSYDNLCTMSITDLEKYKDFLDEEVLYKRARHCITEEDRTVRALYFIKMGDIKSFGKLLCEANISMRDDYQATGKELDTIFNIAIRIEGVIGSRMTGGGFGGCNISLVKKDKVEKFKYIMKKEYMRIIGHEPFFYESNAEKGGSELLHWR